MKLQKILDEGNAYGYETIEIIHFNYNGDGDAIGLYDGGNELEFIHHKDLDLILFGDPVEGSKWYKMTER